MSYTPTVWANGDTITAAKMNKIEQGIVTAESSGGGGGGGITTETDPTVPSWAKQSSKPSYNFSEIGSKPTTLSGYGITNAYTKTEVNNLISGSGSGSTSGGYDLVIASNTRVSKGIQVISNWSIISGSIADCEDKLENGLPINAIAIVWMSQWSMDPPNDERLYLPLVEFLGPYHSLHFGGIFNSYSATNSTASWYPTIAYATFAYNATTKQLTHAHYNTALLALQ